MTVGLPAIEIHEVVSLEENFTATGVCIHGTPPMEITQSVTNWWR